MRSICAAALLLSACPAFAQTAQPPTSAASGSESVIVNGKSALRVGDVNEAGAIVVQGSPNVLINGKPAAVNMGCAKGGSVGSSNVFINGKPIARVGDTCEKK